MLFLTTTFRSGTDINFSQVRNLSWGYEYLSYLHFVLEKASQIGFKSLLDVGCANG